MNGLPAGYELTFDPARIDAVAAHAYLTRSYWSPGIPLATVQRAIANSLCVAVFHGAEQVAFARVITDKATFGWLADVFVLEDHRGRGLSKAMVAALLAHPELQGLRRWALSTLDAHDVYRPFGWDAPKFPDRLMERMPPLPYTIPA